MKTVKTILALLLLCASAAFSSYGYTGEEMALPAMRYKGTTQFNIPKEFKEFPRAAVDEVIFEKESLLSLPKGVSVGFDLPRGLHRVSFDRLIRHKDGTATWIGGSVKNGVTYRTILTFNGETVVGTIQTPDGAYAVQHIKGAGTMLVDTNAAPSLPKKNNEPFQKELPDGRVIVEDEVPSIAALPVTPYYQLSLPEYFRQKTWAIIKWKTPEGTDGTRKATFRFSKNGTKWIVIKKIKVEKEMFYWRPNKKRITDAGFLQMCAKPMKGKTIAPICETVSDIKVLGFDVSEPPDTIAPDVPQNMSASAVTASSATLCWNASDDYRGVVGYRLYRSGSLRATVPDLCFTDNGLVPKTEYSYAVSAFDAADNESDKSSAVSVKTLADTAAPSVPAISAAAALSSTELSVSWSGSTDNVGVKGYNYYRNGVKIKSVAGTVITDAGLTPGLTYVVKISAFDAAGNESALSDPRSVTMPGSGGGGDTTKPTVPTGLKVELQGYGYLKISWNPSTDDSGSVGYFIYRNGILYIDGNWPDPFFLEREVKDGETYIYEIEARDPSGNAAKSAPLSAKTKTLPATSVVDVLIYYQSDLPGGTTSVYNAVDTANLAFSDSNVPMEINPVAVIAVAYPAGDSNAGALDSMSLESGGFASLSSLEKQYKADLVAFLRPYAMGDGTCGVAILNDGFRDFDVLEPIRNMSVSVITSPYCQNTVFSHEMGHNMGLDHDVITSGGSEGLYPYSRGYMLSDGSLGDIMSYAGWNVVLKYSSPDILVNGIPLGITVGQPNEADAAKSLRETRGVISDFDIIRGLLIELF